MTVGEPMAMTISDDQCDEQWCSHGQKKAGFGRKTYNCSDNILFKQSDQHLSRILCLGSEISLIGEPISATICTLQKSSQQHPCNDVQCGLGLT